jgi:hypothetical protein
MRFSAPVRAPDQSTAITRSSSASMPMRLL